MNLVAYEKQHGHFNVPMNDKTYQSLARWVERNRCAFKNGKLPKERVAELNKIGFIWERPSQIEEYHSELIVCKARDGAYNVPLWKWVSGIHIAFNRSIMESFLRSVLQN